MNHTEKILEFDQIKNIWAGMALMNTTKKKIMDTRPCLNESELLLLQRETSEARDMLEKCGTPPIPSFGDVIAIMNTAQKESFLSAEQLETMGNTFIAIRRLSDYLNRCKSYNFSLAYYEENLDSCDELATLIQQQIRNGAVTDRASSLLLSIRRDLELQDSKMRDKTRVCHL